jgi:chemotaxis protein methyltransferase CheR
LSSVIIARDEATLEPAEFATIASVLHECSGIRLNEGNGRLVVSRLSRRLRELGLNGFAEYARLVTDPGQREERYRMVLALTTNTTRFFREPEHFEILAAELLPVLAVRAASGHRARLWSAGCSSGEEAWSLAAVVLEGFSNAAKCGLRILATDIDREVLERAETGIYPEDAASMIPPARRAVMFEPAPDRPGFLSIRPALRALVTFRYMNFVEPWPVQGPFDAILCRNVAIYMDEATQRALWCGLERVLDEGGYLFLGHSERLGPGFEHALELCGKTSFRRPANRRGGTLQGS